jgi:hypothetical protein
MAVRTPLADIRAMSRIYVAHELRNAVVEELIAGLVGESSAESDVALMRDGRNREVWSKKGRR